MMSAGTDVCNQSTVCSCVSRDVSFSSMKGDLEDDFLEDFVEKEGEASLHSTILSNTAKYIQKSSQYKPDVRQYFDPFHATHPSNSSAQLTSPIRESSQTLDEYSSVAGHYFKDIIIPRVSSRKSNSRKSRSQVLIILFFAIVMMNFRVLVTKNMFFNKLHVYQNYELKPLL